MIISIGWVYMILIGTVVVPTGLVFALLFKERRDDAKTMRQMTFEARRREQALDTQQNIANRIFNHIKHQCEARGLSIERRMSDSSQYIHVFQKGVRGPMFQERSVVAIFVNVVDKSRILPIFVRYFPGCGSGFHGIREENIRPLIEDLLSHISADTRLKAAVA